MLQFVCRSGNYFAGIGIEVTNLCVIFLSLNPISIIHMSLIYFVFRISAVLTSSLKKCYLSRLHGD